MTHRFAGERQRRKKNTLTCEYWAADRRKDVILQCPSVAQLNHASERARGLINYLICTCIKVMIAVINNNNINNNDSNSSNNNNNDNKNRDDNNDDDGDDDSKACEED